MKPNHALRRVALCKLCWLSPKCVKPLLARYLAITGATCNTRCHGALGVPWHAKVLRCHTHGGEGWRAKARGMRVSTETNAKTIQRYTLDANFSTNTSTRPSRENHRGLTTGGWRFCFATPCALTPHPFSVVSETETSLPELYCGRSSLGARRAKVMLVTPSKWRRATNNSPSPGSPRSCAMQRSSGGAQRATWTTQVSHQWRRGRRA